MNWENRLYENLIYEDSGRLTDDQVAALRAKKRELTREKDPTKSQILAIRNIDNDLAAHRVATRSVQKKASPPGWGPAGGKTPPPQRPPYYPSTDVDD